LRNLKSLAFFALAAAILSGFSSAPAQVSVNIGVAPVCAYGYYDFEPYGCAPYGYYGPDWFVGGVLSGAYSSGLDPGFTVRVAFMATSTTVTILGMATPDRTLTAGRSRSTISMQMRRGTDKAM
jgi:hypothetical protein